MTKGFVTIATGKEMYYAMARNLLMSYRFHNHGGPPFAIICDRENNYTEDFDDVVSLAHIATGIFSSSFSYS